MLNWFYYKIMTRVQGARNGSQENNEVITKGNRGFIKNERWSNGETNCIRLEFKSEDNKHIQAKNLGQAEDTE